MEAQLQNDFDARHMTEKIFNGKLMEIKGRKLVMSGGRGRMTVQMRADERLGRWMMGETEEEETAVPKVSPMSRPKPRRHRHHGQGSSHLHRGLRAKEVKLQARTMRSLQDQPWTSAVRRSL